MVFNSLTFVVFFACVLALQALPLSWTTKKINLLIASYLFYAAWNPPFVILLWISTVVDWYAAQGLVKARRQVGRRLEVHRRAEDQARHGDRPQMVGLVRLHGIRHAGAGLGAEILDDDLLDVAVRLVQGTDRQQRLDP
ncbi:MAG: hypothetical protein JOY74_01195, partial [Sinobacteraceae bacterium]|nr:hypothetical protein [Nevskiaceae bacterium]